MDVPAGVTSYELRPAQDAATSGPPPGVESYELTPPSMGEVLKSAAKQPGLDFIQATGGALRGLGDLTSSRSLQDVGAELYKNASGAQDETTPVGMTLPQQILFGGAQSFGDTVPFLVAAAATGGTATLPILAAGAQQAGQRYGQLREENFSGGRAAVHAGLEGVAEMLGEKIGLPVLYKGNLPFLHKLAEFTGKEMVGEQFTTFAEQMSAMLSDQPDMTWKDFLDAAAMTAAIVPTAAIPQAGVVHGIQRLRGGALQGHGVPAGAQEEAPSGQTSQGEQIAPTPATPEETAPEAPKGESTKPTAPPEGVEEFQLIGQTPEELANTQERKLLREKYAAEAESNKNYDREELLKELNLPLFPEYTAQAPAETHSPDQMQQEGHVDPMLYNGLPIPSVPGAQLGITYQKGAGYSLYSAGMERPVYALSNDDAVKLATQLTGVDMQNNPQALREAHMGATMNTVFDGKVGTLSNSVLEYYGPDLREAIAKQAAQDQKVGAGQQPLSPLIDVYRRIATNGAMTAERLGYKTLGKATSVYIQPVGSQETQSHIGELHGIAGGPGTYAMYPSAWQGRKLAGTETTVQAAVHAMAGKVEAWRKTYAPDMKVAVAARRGGPDNLLGSMHRLADGSFILSMPITPSATSRQITATTFMTLAHEFGHALIMHEFLRTDPATASKLVNEWMNESSRDSRDPQEQLRILGELGGAGRASTLMNVTRTISTDGSTGEVGHNHVRYMLGFDEYMADRVANYLHNTDQVFSPEERTLYQRIVNILQGFFYKFGSKYKVAPTFDDWMNQLRGNRAIAQVPSYADKPVDVGPKPQKGDLDFTKKKVQIDLGPLKPNDFDKLMRTALPIQNPTPEEQGGTRPQETPRDERKARSALARFMTAEEMKAFEHPDGSLDFDEAYKFLESMGQDTGKLGDYYDRSDDTTMFRGQVSDIAFSPKSVELKLDDLKSHFIRANESIKNFNWFLEKTLTAVQIRKRFGDQVPGAKQFVDLLEKMHAYRSRWKALADDRVHQMRSLAVKEREAVFKLLIDEDAKGTYLTSAVKNQDGSLTRILDPKLAKEYAIGDAGARLYNSLISDFKKSLDELETLAKNEIQRGFGGGEMTVERQRALAKAMTDLEVEFAKMRAKPYVPHTRFGEYTVTVYKDGKVQEFYQFESKHAAKTTAEKMRRAGKDAAAGVMREDIRTFLGLPPQLIGTMKQSLNLNAEQIAQFEDLIKELSSGQSFVRRMQERKNIPGYENDAEKYPRVYADYFSRFANHAARLKFNYQLNDAQSAVRQQIKTAAQNADDTVNMGKLLNWMQRTQEWAVSPRQEWANVRAAVTMWYLGFSVKSAFVNSMSVPMVTAPYLSQRFGWVRAAAEVSRAYRDLARHWTKAGGVEDDALKMMENLRGIGVLDESLSANLAGIREGGTLGDLTALGTLAGNAYRLKTYGMWMFHKIELINRYSTALAAYRLARQTTTFDPNDLDGFDKNAAQFAKLTVQDTQNENGQWNRAEMMRGGKSVFTMFMSYQQNLTYQMLGGDSSWMRLMAVQLVVAGLMGLPFAADLDNLIKWFSRKVLGDDQSINKAVRAYLEDTMVNPDWLLQGASYNVFGADLQGSLSMGSTIPGLDALAMEGDFNSRLANAAGDVGGAGASTILAFMKAIASNEPDSIRRFQRTLPTAAQNVLDSYQMLTTGHAQNGAGQTIADVDKADASMKALGFQPTTVNQESNLRFVQKDTTQYWLTRREYVIQKYYRGLQAGDTDLVAAAREDLATYNADVPSGALRIDSKSLREALVKKFKTDAVSPLDIPSNTKDTELYRQVEAMYRH